MTLTSQYQRFSSSPTTDGLADNAVISYIPTIVSIQEPEAILKHLGAQAKQLTKKNEKVLSAIEGNNGLCLDVETTLQFKTGGGAYLPGLDDNFLADRVVTFPVIHIIQFDGNGKIQTIRLYWDQGSLLRNIEVIGARGKNWPIRDGKDQIRLISATSSAAGQPVSAASSRRNTTSSRGSDEARVSSRPQSKASNKSATNDRHQSLSLFGPQDEEETTPQAHPRHAMRQSAKPPPRDYSELFASEGPETPPPKRPSGNTMKSGAGKNFQNVRLFEGEEDSSAQNIASPERSAIKTNSKKYNHFEFGHGEDATPTQPTPQSSMKTNPKKYQHFDFGDGEEAGTPTASPSKPVNAKKYNHFEFGDGEEAKAPKPLSDITKEKMSKHNSQWNFEDFVTPEKPTMKARRQDARHFGWSDDEVEETPIKRPVVHSERPDARPHFEFADDGTPQDAKRPPPTKGRVHNSGLELYNDHITGGDFKEKGGNADQNHLRTTSTNMNSDHRRQDFGAHWEMTDTSPSVTPRPSDTNSQTTEGATESQGTSQIQPAQKRSLSTSNQRVLKGLDSSWDTFDDVTEEKKENEPNTIVANRPRVQGGDGMGSRKGTTRNWGFGDDSDPEDGGPAAKGGNIKQQKAGHGRENQKPEKTFWDF